MPDDVAAMLDRDEFSEEIKRQVVPERRLSSARGQQWLIAVLFKHDVVDAIVHEVDLQRRAPDLTAIEMHKRASGIGGDAEGAAHAACDHHDRDDAGDKKTEVRNR